MEEIQKKIPLSGEGSKTEREHAACEGGEAGKACAGILAAAVLWGLIGLWNRRLMALVSRIIRSISTIMMG